MPPKSEAQRRLMQAAAHDPKVAAKTGVSSKVAKEFADADPGGKLPAKAKSKKKGPNQFALPRGKR
ncbi:hypothetical protein NKG99_20545 [Mesorhizobium sp. M1409]|uniref:hypothetical protein n=1 Tax=Mesorhizobium sp. M1409 TaxID=2957100 RepID=UPI00333A5DF0